MRVYTLLLLLFGGVTSSIAPDEEVHFFPTAAHLDKDKAHWVIPIHGWIFEPEKNDLLRRKGFELFRESLGLKDGEADTALFKKRAWPFLADNERAKRVQIRIDSETYTLPPSGANGHFRGTIRLPVAAATKLIVNQGRRDPWLAFRAITPKGDERKFDGKVRLLEETGLSVVSDMDDTVKISEVPDKSALLRNTFLRDYRAVEGMAELYRRWAEGGAAFHYVSDSPWQLYRPLEEFLNAHKFPPGTMDLKNFRWKDASFFDLFTEPLERKRKIIEPMLEAFPRRTFILVGDSGERDAEVYSELARKYPKQVRRILILDKTGQDQGRYQKAFDGVPRERWQIFADAKEIKDLPGEPPD
jgi:hypothetical protein